MARPARARTLEAPRGRERLSRWRRAGVLLSFRCTIWERRLLSLRGTTCIWVRPTGASPLGRGTIGGLACTDI
jgi:hypothetical protein